MRYAPIKPALFLANRRRLAALLAPRSLAVVNANDVLPTNADATLPFVQNSDLFYLTGVDQEESILLLYPDAPDEKEREILFLRETSDEIATWEGHKLTKEQARQRTGVQNVQWLDAFPQLFRTLMCESAAVYLNANEHTRASVEVETREARFVRQVRTQFPLHRLERLAPLLTRLRMVKAELEIDLIRRASALTEAGFRRVLGFVRPGVREMEIEAELAHEFLRNGGGFAYPPIVAAGANACILHYIENDQVCKKGQLLLLDVGASYAHYMSDLTRTIPVSGRFSRRQRQVYLAVLRVLRAASALAVPGKRSKEWQKEVESLMEKELVELGLLKMAEIKRQSPDQPALKKYFMHGIGHQLGLDVHDVSLAHEPMQPGWVLTVEPGIYIKEEGLAVRLENDIVLTQDGPVDLMAGIPIEPDEIEALMRR